MKHVLKVPRRLNAPSEALTTLPVWISDALLDETFARFSRCCRRHGSHVPGPLESRKRASRRKNTSIAYTRASAAPIDGVGLFGAGSQGGWWKPEPLHRHEHGLGISVELPKIQESERAQDSPQIEPPQSLLSSWFRKPPPPPIPQTNVEDRLPQSKESSLLSEVEFEATKNVFGSDLLKARSLVDVKALVQELELDFPQKRALTDLACKRILKLRLGPDALKEYILDSAFSSPASQTLHFLTNTLRGQRKWLAHEARAEVFETICQCISLGVATIEDVKYLITNVPRFQIPAGAGLKFLRRKDSIHDAYGRILSAIEESKVISLSDLGKQYLGTWFRDISFTLTSPAATQLLWKLGCILEKPKKALATKILTRSVSYDLGQNLNKIHNISLLKFLEEVPTSLLPDVLIQTTSALVHRSKKHREKGHMSIQRWHDFLVNLNYKTVFRAFVGDRNTVFAPSIWQEALSHPGSSEERAKRALIACWVTASMSKEHEHTKQLLRKLGLRNIFRNIYSSNDGKGSRDVLAQVLVTVQSLPLPNTVLLLKNLRFITNDYLVYRNTKFAQRVAEENLVQHFSVLEHDADYDRFRNHFNDALVELAESVNRNLPQFLQIARTFVEKDEVAFRIVTRILKHNLAFRNALYRSSLRRATQDRADIPRAQDFPHVDPQQALNFINHLAVYFATSPVIGPRQALRRVYWCYTVLHRYGGPIETPIVRALWHAGVTRYHQAGRGAPNTVLRWILMQVRRVEGDKVADMLLTSHGFRNKMEQQFANFAWLHGEKMPAEIDGLQWLDPNTLPVELHGPLEPSMQQGAIEHHEERKHDTLFCEREDIAEVPRKRLFTFNWIAGEFRLLKKQIRILDKRLRQIAQESSQ
jgi:hypothetical protein